MTTNSFKKPLCQEVKKSLEDYFSQLDGEEIIDLHSMVISEVEKPLLEAVLAHTKSNQSRAAKMLGLSRGTLRKKMSEYHIE